MATVTGLTKERMEAIEAASIVDAELSGDNLILTKYDGTPIDVGNVRGPQGIQGDPGNDGIADPWVLSADVWTFGAADAPSYTMTTPRDVTTEIGRAMRVRLTHGGIVKYFIVTDVVFAAGSSTVTMLAIFGTSLSATAITLVSFSSMKAPIGFDTDPLKWTVELRDVTQRVKSVPAQNIWYNIGLLFLDIPKGAWKTSFAACIMADENGTSVICEATISTTDNTETDEDFSLFTQVDGATFNAIISRQVQMRSKDLLLAAKTRYYVNARTLNSGADEIVLANSLSPLIVRAVCAYL